MKFPKTYKVLETNTFSIDEYQLIPIRYEDRMDIMKWRNEQVFHLRQKELLTRDQQEKYFSEVVSTLFTLPQPNQILFYYLKNNECIGYG